MIYTSCGRWVAQSRKNGIRPREKRENGKSWPELASTNLISPLLLLLLLLLQCCCGAVAAANAATAATSGAPSTLALSHSHNMNNNWDQLIHHHYDFLIVVPLLVKFSGGKHFFSFTSQVVLLAYFRGVFLQTFYSFWQQHNILYLLF